MSILTDVEQAELTRTAANGIKNFRALKQQIVDDKATRTTLQAKIKADVAVDNWVQADILALVEAQSRITYGNTKKNALKADLLNIRDQINNTAYKTEIQDEANA